VVDSRLGYRLWCTPKWNGEKGPGGVWPTSHISGWGNDEVGLVRGI